MGGCERLNGWEGSGGGGEGRGREARRVVGWVGCVDGLVE